MKLYVLLVMLAMHVVGDYILQGILASMKQRMWWVDKLIKTHGDEDGKLPSSIWHVYQNDFIPALLAHAYLWSFCIMLPIAIAMYIQGTLMTDALLLVGVFLGNLVVHAVTDHLKANIGAINLVEDQGIHFVQILITAIVML